MAASIFGGTGTDVQVAETVQDMADTSKRYHYTGLDETYEHNGYYQYEVAQHAWKKLSDANTLSISNETLVLTPQEMANTSNTYQFIGPEDETFKTGRNYIFNGSHWVEESLNYNSYVAPNRKLFLGETKLDGDIDYSQVNSCYDNLKTWLSETGGYAKVTKRGDLYFLDLLEESGVESNAFCVEYGTNVLDASQLMSCENLVTGIYVKGIWKGTKEDQGEDQSVSYGESENPSAVTEEDPDYELLLTRLHSVEVRYFGDMTDKSLRYLYTGPYQVFSTYHATEHKVLYQYDGNSGLWVEVADMGQASETVSSVFLMTDTTKLYKYDNNQKSPVTFTNGAVYHCENEQIADWTQDTEVHTPVLLSGFEIDAERGVLWNTEAKNTYGEIVKYLEVDVANVVESQRLQHMAEKATEELQNNLLAFISLDATVVDPRVIGMEGEAPVLGNFYPADISWLGLNHAYKRLSKIVTNMLDEKNTKMTLGNRTPLLSDYVAKKGERL